MSTLEIVLFSSLILAIVAAYVAVVLLLRKALKPVEPAKPWVPAGFLYGAFIPGLGIPVAMAYHGILLYRLRQKMKESDRHFPWPAHAVVATLAWIPVLLGALRPNPAFALAALVGLVVLAFTIYGLGRILRTPSNPGM